MLKYNLMSNTIIITSKDCPVCKELPKDDPDVKYIDIDSPEAKKYNVDEVPSVFVGDQKCRLMKDTDTDEIFINCPTDD